MIGGSELAIKHLTDRLPEFDFDLITWRGGPKIAARETLGRVSVYRVGRSKLLLPLAILIKAIQLMRTRGYVLVHAYQASHAAIAGALLRLLVPDVPFILTLQEGKELDAQPWYVRWPRNLIVRRADTVTVISNYLANFAHKVGARQIQLIPNGVQMPGHDESIKNPDPTLITVSRLVLKNNVEGVIRALPLVREHITNARFAIIGDGPLRPELEQLASELSVRDVVDFLGTVPQSQVDAVLRMADVFVRPSLSEGLGSAFLEAMAARVPVVASPVGGIPDIVEHEATGLLCDPHDIVGIANAIVRILQDTELRKRIVAAAYEQVRLHYTWDGIAQQMGMLYAQSLNPKS
jgi:glycosyltransferase involved in cell wall biosynthesis